MKNCEIIQKLLIPFTLNELNEAETKVVKEHLETCLDCSRILSQQQQLFKQLDSWGDIEPSIDLYNQLKRKVELKKKHLIQKILVQFIALKHYMTVRRTILGIALIGLICLFTYTFDVIHREANFESPDDLSKIAVIDTNKNTMPTLIDSILSFSSAPAKQTKVTPISVTSSIENP